MEITIRETTTDDALIISRYNTLMAMETEGRCLDPQIVTKGVITLLNHPDRGFYLIAEINGEPIGQCMITYEWSDWRCGDFWWIQSVYVIWEYRQQGVFTALYDQIIKKAEESDQVAGIRLYVEKENISAQKVYQRLGMNLTQYMMFERDFTYLTQKE
jgi:ribosomal protein S18 acetylase RimI-like enzyme